MWVYIGGVQLQPVACWYHKRAEKREKNALKIINASGTTHSVIRPLVLILCYQEKLLFKQ